MTEQLRVRSDHHEEVLLVRVSLGGCHDCQLTGVRLPESPGTSPGGGEGGDQAGPAGLLDPAGCEGETPGGDQGGLQPVRALESAGPRHLHTTQHRTSHWLSQDKSSQ